MVWMNLDKILNFPIFALHCNRQIGTAWDSDRDHTWIPKPPVASWYFKEASGLSSCCISLYRPDSLSHPLPLVKCWLASSQSAVAYLYTDLTPSASNCLLVSSGLASSQSAVAYLYAGLTPSASNCLLLSAGRPLVNQLLHIFIQT